MASSGKQAAANAAPGYLIDFMPTVLDLTGATYPREFAGQAIQPFVGRSLAPILRGGDLPADRWLYGEQYNNNAVRHAAWKAVQPAEPNSPWELYDLASDPTELRDQATTQPARLRELTTAWTTWANTHRVLPKTIPATPATNSPPPSARP